MHAVLVLAVLSQAPPPVTLAHLGDVVTLWVRAHDATSWRAAAETLDARAGDPDLALAAVAAWRNALAAAPPPRHGIDDKPRPQPLSEDAGHLLRAGSNRSSSTRSRGMQGPRGPS